ncbi:hypothetical protein CALCODRAFT_719 [Calocera cornea HHB12733]|uniref:Uncharacterized protein n=1 Tax=Calocera cornea HHB12733 TaxID=1353952 RepID=A0A165K764_9BASI|nr:hypothetical protein CALCODRAFT_719 [Calocera cornea HHB12733]
MSSTASATATSGHTVTSALASATKSAASKATTSAAAATQNAAKNFRNWQIKYYPLQLWWFVASLIGFCMLLYGCGLVQRYWRLHQARPTPQAGEAEKEGELVQEGKNGAASWRNFSAGVATVWKVVLYRTTLPISWDHQKRMNVAEVSFCGAYLLACLTWAYVLS